MPDQPFVVPSSSASPLNQTQNVDLGRFSQGAVASQGRRTWRPDGAVPTEEHVGRIRQLYAQQLSPDNPGTFYDGTDFLNYGYWAAKTPSQHKASKTLVQLLLSFLPTHGGRVLDVGCGKGAAIDVLKRTHASEDIIGINISPEQLQICRNRHPDIRFFEMDATTLDFEDNSFDVLMSVDAIHQFVTRDSFLSEAIRVLKPNGFLIFSDLLLGPDAHTQPPANMLEDAAAYAELGLATGFARVEVYDTTQESWIGFATHHLNNAAERAHIGEIPAHEVFFTRLFLERIAPRACVAGWMRKRGEEK